MNNRRLSIAFIHRDLGIGGGERLVIDAARCLQRAGHRVTIFTGHHDREHCFEETRDGTLDVRVFPPRLPDEIFQRLRVACATARMSTLAAAAVMRAKFDVVFCDLIPHAIPAVKLLSRAKIIYYCHYPDRAIDEVKTRPQRMYRLPFERLEEAGLKLSDRVLFNSIFTAAQFRKAYPRLGDIKAEILYPGVDPAPYDAIASAGEADSILLSINRFSRLKNLALAIEAFAAVRDLVSGAVFRRQTLVMAGGCDPCDRENQEVQSELKALAERLGLRDQVVFKPSCSEAERLRLLARCRCLVYTPDEEHFGFGPVEAMAAGRPVVAVNSGGPRETVVDGETGLLVAPTPPAFAGAIARLLADPTAAGRMGRAGRERAAERFSLSAFARSLEAIVNELAPCGAPERMERAAVS